MDRRTVLLVHAGAPSSKSFDQQAIAQAESYLSMRDHEPARITVLIASGVREGTQSTTVGNPSEVARVSSSDIHIDKELSNRSTSASVLDQDFGSEASFHVQNSLEYIEDTQLAYTALESQLFTSSAAAPANSRDQRRISLPHLADVSFDGLLANAQNDRRTGVASPATGPLYGTAPEVSNEQHSSGSGNLGIPAGSKDCSYERQAKRPCRTVADDVEHVASTQRVQATPSGTPFGSSAPVAATPVCTIAAESRIAGTPTSDETTSELPRSYSWGDSTSDCRSHSFEYRHKHSVNEHRPTPSQDVNRGPVADVCHSQLLGTVKELSSAEGPIRQLGFGEAADDQIDVGTALEGAHVAVSHLSVTTSKHALTPPRPQRLQVSATEPSEAELLALAPEIHARKPNVSVKAFDTSITKELRELYGKFATKYEPLVVSREIETLERGHWSINCSSWSAGKKLAFWRFLEIWIGNGSAGWSVWCSRVADQRIGSDIHAHADTSTADTQSALDHLRVYCWGEIIGHIYILLYTASEGGVRKLGLQWIDSDLKVVVQMRPPTVTRLVSAIGAS